MTSKTRPSSVPIARLEQRGGLTGSSHASVVPHRRPDVIALGTELRRAGILVDTDGSLNAWFTDSEGSILGLVEGQGDQMT